LHAVTDTPRIQGGEDTFGQDYQFTEDLRAVVAQALPKLTVKVIVYPRYETRGDLHDCVSRFRDWLLEKVIDIEVANGTPSPTVDPSVRTILIGHSMGGIVAAETAIALTSDKVIPAGGSTAATEETGPQKELYELMFPYIQGILAFDTPFLGISPGVVAHGAEGHYATASQAISQLSGLTALWGGAKVAADAERAKTKDGKSNAAPLPAPNTVQKDGAPAAAGGWGQWGKIAMYAGAAGAVAAGGAAAYYNRNQISEGWNWAFSHLEFVGTLAKKEDLRRRVAYMVRLNKELDMGFANLYTRLGNAAGSKEVSMVGTVLGTERTFCIVPKKEAAGEWDQAINDKATDETWAHMGMFTPKDNPGYNKLVKDGAALISRWSKNDWYEGSSAAQIESAV
jgi:hypothetical protein